MGHEVTARQRWRNASGRQHPGGHGRVDVRSGDAHEFAHSNRHGQPDCRGKSQQACAAIDRRRRARNRRNPRKSEIECAREFGQTHLEVLHQLVRTQVLPTSIMDDSNRAVFQCQLSQQGRQRGKLRSRRLRHLSLIQTTRRHSANVCPRCLGGLTGIHVATAMPRATFGIRLLPAAVPSSP